MPSYHSFMFLEVGFGAQAPNAVLRRSVVNIDVDKTSQHKGPNRKLSFCCARNGGFVLSMLVERWEKV
jgi:hypothetical protein